MTCSVHNIVKEALENQRTDRDRPLVEKYVVINEKEFSLFNDDISRRLKEQYQVESDENVFLVRERIGTVQKPDYYGHLEKYTYTGWMYNTPLLDKLEYNRLNPTVSLQITQGIFDPELAEKLQNKLQQLYPEIRLNITNTPVWEQGDNIFNQEEYNSKVNYRFKTTEKVLDNLDKIKQWESNKSITPEILWKKIQELGIPKEQLTLLKESKGNTVEEKLASFVSNYSYTVKTEVAKEALSGADYYARLARGEKKGYSVNNFTGKWNVFSPENEIVAQFETEAEARKEQTRLNKLAGSPTQYYASLTVPGGTNYTENEIITPEIIPFEKGHAQFSTDKGIGWFRSDDKISENVQGEIEFETYDVESGVQGEEIPGTRKTIIAPKDKFTYAGDVYEKKEPLFDEEDFGTISYFKNNKPITGNEFYQAFDAVNQPTKTRRILEVQSDLFQKGRDKEELSKTPVSKKLLNKLKNVGVDVGQKFNVKGTWFEVFAKKTEGTTTLYHVKNLLNETKTSWVTSETIYNAVKDYYETKDFSNNFLQLLNKNNNWVNFFVKSIIQDSAKKGYEKVLFPSGNTASKVEGHTTLEEFKKQKEDRLKQLDINESRIKNVFFENVLETFRGTEQEFKDQKDTDLNNIYTEREQLKQELERIEKEGFAALAPIYNFYENTVANILKKQGYSPIQITDEYGNTWNEVTINQARDLGEVLLQRNQANKIIGQANIKAMTVLIDAINQKQDTLPHEYAHHYIAWFRDTPLVQEAISKWGSEEALVQSIGEQAVKQKGEAWNWWNRFVNWLLGDLRKLSKLDKERLTKILTDAFLSRRNLSKFFGEVKPGVEELFESNQDLANAVYEALGFNNLRKEYSNVIIDQVWKRLASEGITNADSLIGTRETINNKDFNKFWSAVKDVDIQNVIKFFESEKQKALDSYSKYKGEFDPTTGIFTSNDTSFFDNKIKDLNTLLQQKQQAQQLYSQYLDTIFPDSKVKDIVYHGTSGFPFEKFSKEFIGKSRNAITSLEKGFYFTNNKKLSKLTAREFLDDSIIVDGKYEFAVDVFTDYAFKSESEISKIVGYDVFLKKYEINTVQDYLKKTYPNKDYKLEYYKPTPGFNKGIASVVLDIKEPTVKDLKGERILDAIPTEKEYRKIIEENDDSIIFENVVDTTRGTKEEYLGNTYVVFEPEQIHILGNEQDIEGFKEFVRAEEAQEEYIREKEKESQERLKDFYMGDFALREQELRDLEEFRNNNSNMPDEDIDDYFLGCKL